MLILGIMTEIRYKKTEAAQLLGVSKQTIHNWVNDGETFPHTEKGQLILSDDIRKKRASMVKELQEELNKLSELSTKHDTLDRISKELLALEK